MVHLSAASGKERKGLIEGKRCFGDHLLHIWKALNFTLANQVFLPFPPSPLLCVWLPSAVESAVLLL